MLYGLIKSANLRNSDKCQRNRALDLANSVVVLQTSSFLAITGSGTISGNGFDATPAHGASRRNRRLRVAFLASLPSLILKGVPEGGSIVALLGWARGRRNVAPEGSLRVGSRVSSKFAGRGKFRRHFSPFSGWRSMSLLMR